MHPWAFRLHAKALKTKHPGVHLPSPSYVDTLLDLRDDDVVLSCFPRSGSTWLRYMLAALRHPQEELSREDINRVMPDIHDDNRPARDAAPMVLKTHVPPLPFARRRTLYLQRDVRDVAASHFDLLRKRQGFEGTVDDYVDQMTAGALWPGDWKGHVDLALAERRHVDMLWVHYEDMLDDPHRILRQVSDWLGWSASDDDIDAAVTFSSKDRVWGDHDKDPKNRGTNYRGGLGATKGGYAKHLTASAIQKLEAHAGAHVQGTPTGATSSSPRPLPASTDGATMLNAPNLLERGRAAHDAFVSASPFPHAVFDDFLPADIADALADAFPAPDEMNERLWQEHNQKAAIFPQDPLFPDALRPVFYGLNSYEVVEFLEALTGIEGIVADPFFVGGGLQQTLPGGRLGMHVDFNFHQRLHLYRRVNMLIYLNRDWDEDWGGHLVLSQKDGSDEVRIAPKFNRCAIFETSTRSWHGHPTPLACPPGQSRKSIAMYFYTHSQGQQSADPHWTQFSQASDQQHVSTSTDDGEIWKHWVKQVVPPVGLKVARRIRDRIRKP